MIPEILTKENFENILQWIDNPDGEMPQQADSFLTTLNLLYMNRKEMKPRRKAATENVPSAKRIAQMDEKTIQEENKALKNSLRPRVPEPQTEVKPQEPVQAEKVIPTNEDGFKESGIDGSVLADAIRYRADIAEKKLSPSMVQMMMYIIYGVWLSKKGERAVTEHPGMHQFGPLFPTVYNHQKKTAAEKPNRDAYFLLQRSSPGLFDLMDRTVMGNMGKRITDFKSFYEGKTTPWAKCRKTNPDKWGASLSDKDIDRWFTNRIKQENRNRI